jgi:hypothetical protein
MVPQVDPKQGDELVQLKQAIQYTREQRKSDAAYEVVYSTSLIPTSDPARLTERTAQYAEAGVTWLLEQLYPQHFGGEWQGNWPVEAMRQRIKQGPPMY